MLAKVLSIAAVTAALISLSACGEKEGSKGADGKATGIHITAISQEEVTVCKEGKGGIRIETYYDTNGNDTKDAGEQVIEDASYIDCYKAEYN